MHQNEQVEPTPPTASGYEPPRVEDVELGPGTTETAPGITPISPVG